MALPVIIAVEEDSAVFENVSLQLAERYQRSYRIESLRHAGEAAEVLQRLAHEGADVALLLADLPALRADEGGLFDQARHLHPQAKRVLLASPNVWLDPPRADVDPRTRWDLGRSTTSSSSPASRRTRSSTEAISSFLLEWARNGAWLPPPCTSSVRSGRAAHTSCGRPSRAAPSRTPSPWRTPTRDASYSRRPRLTRRLPLMVLPDGRRSATPRTPRSRWPPARRRESRTRPSTCSSSAPGRPACPRPSTAPRRGCDVVVVDAGGIGGQARSSSLIRNYLGFAKGVSGSRLAEQAYEQASVFGANFVFMHRATGLTRSGEELRPVARRTAADVAPRTVILATGASYRRLGIPELEALTGAGVFYGGPVSEAPALAGRAVFVARRRQLRGAGGPAPRPLRPDA